MKKFPIRFSLWLRKDQRESLKKLSVLCNQSENEVLRTAMVRHANALRKTDEFGEVVKFPLDRSEEA